MAIVVKMEMLEELTNTIKKLEEKAGEYPILLVEVEKLKEEFARLRNLCPVEMKWEEEMDENPDYNEQNATALPAEIVRIKKEEKLQIYNPEDVDIFYDALSHLDFQGQVSKDYEDNFSLQDSTKVTAMEAAHPVGTKRNQKQHRGHQASRKQKTSLKLTAMEMQQLRPYTKYKKQQIPSKKPQLYKRIKRADIDAINVKIKNYKPLLNLLRLLVHYII